MYKVKKVIFYIDHICYGGAQRAMSTLISSFSDLGIDTVLVNDVIKKREKEYYLPDNTKRYYLSDKKTTKLLRNFSRIHELRIIIIKEKPDIVVSFMKGPNYRLLASSLFLNVKKIISVRSDPYIENGKGIYRIISNVIFLLASGYVFQTNEALQYFYPIIKKKAVVIPNPVSPIFYQVKRQEERNGIISFGRLIECKNQKLLIDAYCLIANEFPLDDLYIFGEGPLQAELKKQIADLNMEKRVHLMGYSQHIENELSKVKLFVLSSNYEGMPNALMEAMAVGIASISTDCPSGGPKDIIVQNRNGILVECDDIKQLSKAIKNMLRDNRYILFGNEAKMSAENFKSNNISKLWLEYFDKIKQS